MSDPVNILSKHFGAWGKDDFPSPALPTDETCLAHVMRASGHTDAAYWQTALRWCHVPWGSPAEDWPDGLARVLASHEFQRSWEE